MAREGYCGVCGRKTSEYVSDDGVLCSKHKRQYDEKLSMIESRRSQLHDWMKPIRDELSEDFPLSYNYHYTESGQYIIECDNCGKDVRVESTSGIMHLCVRCSHNLGPKEEYLKGELAELERKDSAQLEKMTQLKREFKLR